MHFKWKKCPQSLFTSDLSCKQIEHSYPLLSSFIAFSVCWEWSLLYVFYYLSVAGPTGKFLSY